MLALALIDYGGTLLLGAWPLFNILYISVVPGPEPDGHGPRDLAPHAARHPPVWLWGVVIWCCYLGRRWLEIPPYYDKILTVPLVPPFRTGAGQAITMSFRFDRAVFIAAYAGLLLLLLPTLKLQCRSAEYYRTLRQRGVDGWSRN